MMLPARKLTSDNYRYGFNGKENDDDVKGTGNQQDFGARIYDSRLGRWLSVDPKAKKYPYLSTYNFVENNPTYFNDPDGRDARITIKKNTITFSTVIFIAGANATSAKAQEMQAQIMQSFKDGGRYKDEKGNVYNVKFDIQVKPFEGAPIADGDNLAVLLNKDGSKFRSHVANWNTGIWSNSETPQTFAHEVGHFLGLADRYIDIKPDYESENAAIFGKGRRSQSISFYGTSENDLMFKGLKLSDRAIESLAKFALSTVDQFGKGILDRNALKKLGVPMGIAGPSIEEYRKTVIDVKNSGYSLEKTE